ncbi:MAG TPA: hypothetical protein VES20_13330, partial [Bryobacteraceae bacterium]|nr:hypothetical protein [Bryobacteraceae bacterium]
DVGTNVKQPVVDFYDSMSDYFRQSRRAIDAIVAKGIPDEEIPALLTIARKSSASPNQLMDARKAGRSWAEIASQNKVQLAGEDFVTEANVQFLAEYHGQAAEEVRALKNKGSSFVEIDQQYRRVGTKPRTERPGTTGR